MDIQHKRTGIIGGEISNHYIPCFYHVSTETKFLV
jgi:hypothetical protein